MTLPEVVRNNLSQVHVTILSKKPVQVRFAARAHLNFYTPIPFCSSATNSCWSPIRFWRYPSFMLLLKTEGAPHATYRASRMNAFSRPFWLHLYLPQGDTTDGQKSFHALSCGRSPICFLLLYAIKTTVLWLKRWLSQIKFWSVFSSR